MRFADPWLLLLLAVPAALALRLILRRQEPPQERIAFPALGFLASEGTPPRVRTPPAVPYAGARRGVRGRRGRGGRMWRYPATSPQEDHHNSEERQQRQRLP